jgi:hypothetical protein
MSRQGAGDRIKTALAAGALIFLVASLVTIALPASVPLMVKLGLGWTGGIAAGFTLIDWRIGVPDRKPVNWRAIAALAAALGAWVAVVSGRLP